MTILRPILLVLLLAVLALTLLILPHGARAETYLLGVFDDPPPRHHPHHRPPPRHPAVVVVEPAPPVPAPAPAPVVVVTQPAPTVAATASTAYCREFQTTVLVNGQVQPSYGTACRQPDGAWKIVSQTR